MTNLSDGPRRPMVCATDHWANEDRVIRSKSVAGRPLVRTADHDRFELERVRDAEIKGRSAILAGLDR